MKTLEPLAIMAAVMLLLPLACRKSFDLTEADSDTTQSSGINHDDPSDDVATFIGSYNIAVEYSGTSATATITDTLGNALSAIDSLEVTVQGAGVTIRNLGHSTIHYTLSGSSTAGFFKLYSPARQEIELDKLTLTGSNGAAINNQSDKRTYIVLTGSNIIKDGGSYSSTPADEDERAAFFSEGQICISGSGSLSITASAADGKGGLFSDDYIRFLGGSVSVTASKGHAIRGKDAVIVSGGTINASCSADGKKAVTTDGFFQQDGGSLTASSTGAGIYDTEEKDIDAASGLKCDGDFTIAGGSLTASATGAGGKGVSIGGAATFNGGSVTATASGSNRFYVSSKYSDMTKYSDSYKNYPHSFAKAIKCDAAVVVKDSAWVYGKSSAHEGITCDGTWTQDGGTVIAEAYDDAVNSAGAISLSGGFLRGTSSNNDGIDANAAISVTGGVMIGEGASSPECGIDSVEGTSVTVNGGYVISRGGGLNSFVTTASKAFVQTTVAANAKVALCSGNTQLVAYQAPSSGGTTTLICTPELKSGSSYTLYTGVSSISLADEGFPRFGTSFSGGSAGSSLSASSSAGSSGHGGGGPGGGGGGRW